MPKLRLFLATLALPLDYVLVFLAGLTAYRLRFEGFITELRPVLFDIAWSNFVLTMVVAAGVVVVLFSLNGLYQLNRHLKFVQEISRIIAASTLGLAIIMGWFFFNPTLFGSRFIVLAAWLLVIIFVSLGRVFLRWLRYYFYKVGYGVSRLALIGQDTASQELINLFIKNKSLGFQVVVQLGIDQISNLAAWQNKIDEVIVGDPKNSHDNNLKLLEFCSANHLGFRYAADMFEAQTHNVVVQTLAGVPLIEIKRTPLDGWGRVVKRIFDIVFSLSGLIILSPVFLVLALLVLIDSGRPIWVVLDRVAESNKLFKLYKFRSMIKQAAALKSDLIKYNERSDGPLFKMSNDPRVTSLGKHLRRWSLDELPQLWNVLKGDMSLVGPRPHEPAEVANYSIYQKKLLNIKPGITGLAQISGRSNLSFNEEVKLDLFYIENWSLTQDLFILFKTIFVVLGRRNAV
ncbi:sugar transferase [Patescibacteria group bacterium]|nr:sugar transferase [Patescibacteria group bacterium]